MVMGNIIHERVHSGDRGACRNGYSMTAVTLYNDELDIYGVSDCIEFAPDKNGDYIGKDGQNYTVTLVEYKPTRPKDGEISLPDAVQVLLRSFALTGFSIVTAKGRFIMQMSGNGLFCPLTASMTNIMSL